MRFRKFDDKMKFEIEKDLFGFHSHSAKLPVTIVTSEKLCDKKAPFLRVHHNEVLERLADPGNDSGTQVGL